MKEQTTSRMQPLKSASYQATTTGISPDSSALSRRIELSTALTPTESVESTASSTPKARERAEGRVKQRGGGGGGGGLSAALGSAGRWHVGALFRRRTRPRGHGVSVRDCEHGAKHQEDDGRKLVLGHHLPLQQICHHEHRQRRAGFDYLRGERVRVVAAERAGGHGAAGGRRSKRAWLIDSPTFMRLMLFAAIAST